MTDTLRPLVGALSLLVFWTGIQAMGTETSGSNPYEAIIERNVFGLKPPPPPPDPEANKPPPPKVLFQGITTILGQKRALFKVQIPPKPGEQPKGEQSFILAEGQRDGDIEVLEIDEKAYKVKLKNFGTVMDIDFENNGIKTAAAPAPGAVPKPAGAVPGRPPSPFAPAGGAPGVPTARPLRLPPTGASVSPSSSGSLGGASMAANYGSRTPFSTYTAVPTTAVSGATPALVAGGSSGVAIAVPGGASALTTTTMTQKSWPPEPSSAEEAAIMEAAYLMKNKSAIEQGLLPPIPGTNPLVDSGSSSGQTTTQPSTPTTPPLPPGSARSPILPQ